MSTTYKTRALEDSIILTDENDMSSRACAFVAGMHRGGTSCTADVLAHLGYAAPGQLIGAVEAEPKGHWEATSILRLNDRMLEFSGSSWRDWGPLSRNWHNTPYFNRFVDEGVAIINEVFGDAPMIVLKDPRLSRLTAVWHEILQVSGFSTTVFLPLRHPGEVSASLGVRDQIDPAQAQYLWLRYMLDAELGTRKNLRFIFCYADFVSDWRGTLQCAEARIDTKFPRLNDSVADTVDLFVEQALYRNRARALGSPDELHPLVAEVHDIFATWARSGEQPDDYQRLREIDEEFSAFSGRARPLFVAFDHVQKHLNGLESSIARHKTRLAETGAQVAAPASAEGLGIAEIGEAISAHGGDVGGLQAALATLSQDLLGDKQGLRAALARFAITGEGAALSVLTNAKSEAEIVVLKDELALLHEHLDRLVSEAEQHAAEARATQGASQRSEADAAIAAEQARSAIAELEARFLHLASELKQKRAETDDLYAERDGLNTRVAELEADIGAAASFERSLQTQLARNNDELLTSLDDLVALGNLLRNEEQKCAKLAADRRYVDKKLIALRVRHEAVLDDLVARGNLLLNEEQKCAKLAADRRGVDKRIQEQELTLTASHAEIAALRKQLETEVQNRLDIRAEKQKVDKKLIALRVRHEAVSFESVGHERQLRMMKKHLELSKSNAAASSKILEEMGKRRLALPILSKQSKLFAAIPGSYTRRWQQFCRTLAEEGIFDPESYLALHPDVAAAGVDPLVHFLTQGLAERRTLKKDADL